MAMMRLFKHPLLWVWLVLIGAFVLAGNLPNQGVPTIGQGPSEPQRANQTTQAQPEHSAASGVPIAPNKERKAASVEKADCEGCNDHDNADLYEQRRMAEAAERQNWINIVGVVGVVLSLVFTGWAAIAASRSADAAVQSVALGHATLVASQRPWVYADVKVDGPIKFDASGMIATLKVTLRNTGRDPALHVWPELIICSSTHPLEPLVRQERRSIEVRTRPDTHPIGITLFPGQIRSISITATMPRAEVDADAARMPAVQAIPQAISPIAIGFIDYRFAGSTEHHQAGFAYAFCVGQMGEHAFGGNLVPVRPDPIPQKKIRLAALLLHSRAFFAD
jgi:hypothetical protein